MIKNEARGINNFLLNKIAISSSLAEDKQSETDLAFAKSLSGFLLLQVEDRGQVWYVDLLQNKRVLLSDINNPLAELKELSLGISEENYQKLVQ